MNKEHIDLDKEMANYREDMAQELVSSKADYKSRLDDLDKFLSQSIEELANSLDTVKIHQRDSNKRNIMELMDQVNKVTTDLSKFVDENIDDMMKERRQMINRMGREYINIKNVCSDFFEKYDNSLQEVGIQ